MYCYICRVMENTGINSHKPKYIMHLFFLMILFMFKHSILNSNSMSLNVYFVNVHENEVNNVTGNRLLLQQVGFKVA